MNPAFDQLFTNREVAKLLNVAPKRVYELNIPCVRISARCIRYRAADVEAWLNARTQRRPE